MERFIWVCEHESYSDAHWLPMRKFFFFYSKHPSVPIKLYSILHMEIIYGKITDFVAKYIVKVLISPFFSYFTMTRFFKG